MEEKGESGGKHWYAVYTRSNFEFKARDYLNRNNIESFIPRTKSLSQRRDRKQWIYKPLFRSYVFVYVDLTAENHLQILQSPGIVRFLAMAGKPQTIKDTEIENLSNLDGTDHYILSHPYMVEGTRIMISDGPLKGLYGFYVQRKGKTDRIVVSVDILKRSVALEINQWEIQKISS